MAIDGFYKFFKIYTEEEPLYYYERFNTEQTGPYETEMPVTREFFTGEEGIRNYSAIEFLDRKAKLTTVKRNLEGFPIEDYTVELEPYEFLEEISPFVATPQLREKKRRKVYSFLVRKEEGQLEGHPIKMPKPPLQIPKEVKNAQAKELLKRYIV